MLFRSSRPREKNQLLDKPATEPTPTSCGRKQRAAGAFPAGTGTTKPRVKQPGNLPCKCNGSGASILLRRGRRRVARPQLDAQAGFSGEETSPSARGTPWRRPRQMQEAEAAAGLSQPIPAQLVCLQQPRLRGPGRDTSLGSPRPQHGCSGALLLPSHIQSLTSSLLGSRRSSSSTIKPEQARGTPWLAQAALPFRGAEFSPTPLLPLLAGVKPALPISPPAHSPRAETAAGAGPSPLCSREGRRVLHCGWSWDVPHTRLLIGKNPPRMENGASHPD